LWQIEQRYGVDAATLLAIYGKETSYGSYTGNFDLLEVLASLAYEGRRRAMFESEFLAALRLIQGGVPRSTLRGSYAGATGLPQFMPSVVLRLRVDGDGDGTADIWRNEVDALASIANYFRDAGWQPGLRWGGVAQVPASLNRALIRNPQEEERCPAVFRRHSRTMSLSQWREQGVTLSSPIPQTESAALIEPEGQGELPFLLTANYRVILSYNCSNAYALSVALLSDGIARR
jgi:lytic murein transglycosylase